MTNILEIYNIEKAYKSVIETYKRFASLGIVFSEEQKCKLIEYAGQLEEK
jgi:hypothetical protein